MSEDLGHLTDEDLGHLTDEDFERIGAIVEGSVDRHHGEHILAAVETTARAAEKPHPLLEALARAHQAQAREDNRE
jgi:hypothetical protein